MALLSWIFFGLLVGLAVRKTVPGNTSMGLTITILLGIGGGVIGGFVGTRFGYGSMMVFDPRSLALAFGGAFVLPIVGRSFASQSVV